ncbi:MAG: LytTR family DNA-binding domain-containing protein [Blautia sp.]|nr:LytTR family DNA-binding domain-containing protein [Blautia sp.]
MEDVSFCKTNIMGCNMYSIGICDDGENICTSIENMLLQYAKKHDIQFDTNVWYTGEGLKEYLEAGNQLDILFLDIELFKMTGIDVGNYIRKQLDNMGMQIIYISGKSSYAQQLFKTQPLDFLVKPILQDQINETMETAIRIIKKKEERFEFQQGKQYYYVPMGDIIYLGSERRKIKVVTMKATFEFYGRLKDVAKRLSEDFVVIHQSYIINKEYVFRYTYEMVELMNGTILTISPANRKLVRDRILREE